MIKKKFKRNRTKLVVAAAILIAVTVILNTELSPDIYYLHLGAVENVSCYFEHGGEVSFADDGEFSPSADSIFFHETSCRGGLNSRQACSIEAAARSHPLFEVHVLFLAPVTNISKSLNVLSQFSKVKFSRIHLVKYAENTPVETLVASGGLNRTRWRISHTSDVLRYLTLYKWGGIYLDLDTVVAKPLNGLVRNWSARESDSNVAAGAMAFSGDRVGRMYADAAIRNLADNFRGDIWGHNGPGVITRVLKQKCATNSVSNMSAGNCQGFEVFGPELFYPISWQDAKLYFDGTREIDDKPYIFHVWNKITQNTKVRNNSLYAKLARKFCPNVYEAYGDEFGS